MLGTPVNINPRYETVWARSSGSPSMVKAMSPSTLRSKPVAVITTSASIRLPDRSTIPASSNDSMWSVTIVALPAEIPANRSPSGTNATRWRHGS